MKYGSLIIEKKEYVNLKRILNISGYVEDFETQKSLQLLINELKNAQIVDEADMPEDIIRFNSKIRVSSEKAWEKNLELVIPSEQNRKEGKISVLTQLGATLFGYSEGDVVEWNFPSGSQKLKITDVKQEKSSKKIPINI